MEIWNILQSKCFTLYIDHCKKINDNELYSKLDLLARKISITDFILINKAWKLLPSLIQNEYNYMWETGNLDRLKWIIANINMNAKSHNRIITTYRLVRMIILYNELFRRSDNRRQQKSSPNQSSEHLSSYYRGEISRVMSTNVTFLWVDNSLLKNISKTISRFNIYKNMFSGIISDSNRSDYKKRILMNYAFPDTHFKPSELGWDVASCLAVSPKNNISFKDLYTERAYQSAPLIKYNNDSSIYISSFRSLATKSYITLLKRLDEFQSKNKKNMSTAEKNSNIGKFFEESVQMYLNRLMNVDDIHGVYIDISEDNIGETDLLGFDKNNIVLGECKNYNIPENPRNSALKYAGIDIKGIIKNKNAPLPKMKEQLKIRKEAFLKGSVIRYTEDECSKSIKYSKQNLWSIGVHSGTYELPAYDENHHIFDVEGFVMATYMCNDISDFVKYLKYRESRIPMYKKVSDDLGVLFDEFDIIFSYINKIDEIVIMKSSDITLSIESPQQWTDYIKTAYKDGKVENIARSKIIPNLIKEFKELCDEPKASLMIYISLDKFRIKNIHKLHIIKQIMRSY